MPGFTPRAPSSNDNKIVTFAVALGASLVIGTLDAITGSDISFFVFYLIPVFYVVWGNGLAAGIAISIIDILLWVAVNLVWPMPMHFHHLILQIFSVTEKILFVALFLAIIVQLRAAIIREQTHARVDPQTGLGTTYALVETLQEFMQQKKTGFAVACFDMEGLESLFLREGKTATDRVFRISSLLLKRRVHRCFRVQDDSFVAILDEPEAEEARIKAKNLRDLVQTELETNHGFVVSVDACVLFVSQAVEAHDILNQLNECLRRTKLDAGSELTIDFV